VRLDQRLVDPPGDERLQGRPGCRRPEGVKAPIVQVGDARRKAEAKEMAQREDMVARYVDKSSGSSACPGPRVQVND